MALQTHVHVPEWERPLGFEKPILMLGSCFTEHIGERLAKSGFQVLTNPFGISFNPQSIRKGLHDLLNKRQVLEEELFERDGVWHHWDFHSSRSGMDRQETCTRMNRCIAQGAERVQKAGCLMITFGTAWVYRLAQPPHAIVNNCHKFPSQDFDRHRASTEEIVDEWKKLIAALQKVNPELQLLFTLSPVRHWRDGAQENSLSKATLRLVIEELCEEVEGCLYFPAYEIMMDELRDYRYYAEDMLHPSRLAQQIVWDRFIAAACSEEVQAIANEISDYHRMCAHRPLFPGSSAELHFQEKIAAKCKELEGKYPFFSQ